MILDIGENRTFNKKIDALQSFKRRTLRIGLQRAYFELRQRTRWQQIELLRISYLDAGNGSIQDLHLPFQLPFLLRQLTTQLHVHLDAAG